MIARPAGAPSRPPEGRTDVQSLHLAIPGSSGRSGNAAGRRIAVAREQQPSCGRRIGSRAGSASSSAKSWKPRSMPSDCRTPRTAARTTARDADRPRRYDQMGGHDGPHRSSPGRLPAFQGRLHALGALHDPGARAVRCTRFRRGARPEPDRKQPAAPPAGGGIQLAASPLDIEPAEHDERSGRPAARTGLPRVPYAEWRPLRRRHPARRPQPPARDPMSREVQRVEPLDADHGRATAGLPASQQGRAVGPRLAVSPRPRRRGRAPRPTARRSAIDARDVSCLRARVPAARVSAAASRCTAPSDTRRPRRGPG